MYNKFSTIFESVFFMCENLLNKKVHFYMLSDKMPNVNTYTAFKNFA